jgi:hypothetical protein
VVDRLLTIPEVRAILLNASPSQLRRFRRGPDPLPVVTLSRKLTGVRPADLAAWIARRVAVAWDPDGRCDVRMNVHGAAAAAAGRIAYLPPGPTAPRGRPPRLRAQRKGGPYA